VVVRLSSLPQKMDLETSDTERAASPIAPAVRPRYRLQIGLGLVIFFAYLLGEGRTPPYNDSKVIYGVAEAMVYRNAIGIETQGGTFYAPQPLLPSVIHVPGVALRKAIAGGDSTRDKLVKPMTSHLGSQVVVVLGCIVFFRFLLYLGASQLASVVTTLTLAFATFLPIYARSAWSEACQTACFIGFFSSLVRLRDAPRRGTGLWFGFWAGALVNSKYVFVLAFLGALLFLFVDAARARRLRRLSAALAWPLIPGLAFLLLMLWYNRARTGSLFSSGYPSVAGLGATVLREPVWVGLWSYCFSLGKSIFLYNPPLILSVFALPLVWRKRASIVAAMAMTAGPIVAVYCKFAHWSGDWCWGPRYLLFVVPVLLVPLAFLFDEWRRMRKRLWLALGGALLVAGVLVQVVGASQYWDHFIRISKIAQAQWLGTPNRAGAVTPDRGGSCDPCIEDFYARNYTPAFQPIEWHAWVLWHRLSSDTFEEAAEDMPLRRYTRLDVGAIRGWYERPPWDWWKLDFVGRYRRTGDLVLVLFVVGLLTGLVLCGMEVRAWWRRARMQQDAHEEPVPLSKNLA
jgi:hypothetical protein